VSPANGGEGKWTWLGRYFGTLDVGPGAVQDEWAPRIEYYLPHARYRGKFDLADILSWLLQRRPELSSAMDALGIGARDREDFERGYIATDLAMRSWLADLRGHDGRSQRLIRLAYNANPLDRWTGSSLADKMLASLPGAIENGFSEREALQRILKIRNVRRVMMHWRMNIWHR
jgi:spermidine synthase